MPRDCSICTHERLPEIGRAIGSGESNRSVADRFPGLTAASVQRHKVRHMGKSGPPKGASGSTGAKVRLSSRNASSGQPEGRCEKCGQLVGDSEDGRLEPKDLIRRVERMVWVSETVSAKALDGNDLRLVLLAQDRIKSALDQLLRIHGMVGPDTVIDQRTVNVVDYSKWPTDALQALQAFYKVLEGGGSVKAALEAVETPLEALPGG